MNYNLLETLINRTLKQNYKNASQRFTRQEKKK